jgi:hypothetical protein
MTTDRFTKDPDDGRPCYDLNPDAGPTLSMTPGYFHGELAVALSVGDEMAVLTRLTADELASMLGMLTH